jgi:hypothetical protein
MPSNWGNMYNVFPFFFSPSHSLSLDPAEYSACLVTCSVVEHVTRQCSSGLRAENQGRLRVEHSLLQVAAMHNLGVEDRAG